MTVLGLALSTANVPPMSIPALPYNVEKGTGQLGSLTGTVLVEPGLGSGIDIADRDYTASGAILTPRRALLGFSDIVISTQEIPVAELSLLPDGATVIQIFPAKTPDYYRQAPAGVTFFCQRQLPRNDTTRAFHPYTIEERARATAIIKIISDRIKQSKKNPHDCRMLYIGNDPSHYQAMFQLTELGFNVEIIREEKKNTVNPRELKELLKQQLTDGSGEVYDAIVLLNDSTGRTAAEIIAGNCAPKLRYAHAINLTSTAIPIQNTARGAALTCDALKNISVERPGFVTSQIATGLQRWLNGVKSFGPGSLCDSFPETCIAHKGIVATQGQVHPHGLLAMRRLRDRLNNK
ncbi:MAG: hypothetical protein EYC62_08185 [Alphaproteobacteria bacterium]|nr:MAG: hypothetical protein EYC62_08185 [Alphaproteobacteria bacterium]